MNFFLPVFVAMKSCYYRLLSFRILTLVLTASASSLICYVKPNNSAVSCPGQPCLTIDQYASQGNKYFTTRASFQFLPGNHSTDSTIYLKNVSDMAFKRKENDSNVRIITFNIPFIVCVSATNVTLEGLVLVTSIDGMASRLSSSVLEVFDSGEIMLQSLAFPGHLKTPVRTANINYSNIEILSCYFEGNTGDNGGAMYISNGSNITLDGNIFIHNKATTGGAIFVTDSSLVLNEVLGNTFMGNVAWVDGGALYCFHSVITIVAATNGVTTPINEVCTNEQVQELRQKVDSHTTYFSYNKAYGNLRTEGGGAIYAGKSVVILNGTVTVFSSNSADYGGGAIFNNVSIVTSNSNYLCFFGNRAYNGGAYYGNNDTLHLNSDLAAKKNFFSYKAGRSLIVFAYNRAFRAGGGLCSTETLTVLGGTAINFVGNTAQNGGGIYVGQAARLVIVAKELNFVNNSAVFSGGGVAVYNSIVHVNETFGAVSINFTSNTAYRGGGVRVLQSNVSLSGSLAMYRNKGSGIGSSGPSIISFTGNTVFEENWSTVGEDGGAIRMLLKTRLEVRGLTLFKSNQAYGNGGAIFVFDSSCNFGNTSTFISNRARNGGAMYFEYGATITLQPNSTTVTAYNYARKYGGAIYHRDAITFTQCQFTYSEWHLNEDVSSLPSCFLILLQLAMNYTPYTISSYDDSARIDGSFLYGGLTDKCQLTASSDFGYHTTVLYPLLTRQGVLNITTSTNITAPKNISSEAYELCFCENSQEFNCTEKRSIKTYRGKKFTLNLLALVQGNTTVTSRHPVRAKLSTTTRINPLQIQQTLHPNCSEVSYNLYSPKKREQLVIYLDNGHCLDSGVAQVVVNVALLPCPDGLTLSHDQCNCEERLLAYNADCSVHDNGEAYIAMKAGSKFWVNASYSNGTYLGLILYPSCPLWYCKKEPLNISLNQPDAQCDNNRSGILCGACGANFSLTLGSSKCQACSNTSLLLLLPFAVGGIVLVIFLSVLRLTVATGMINSIILYANILQANRDLLFPNFTNTNVLTVFIAWMNLDLGFQTCFYHGMDAYTQTWLQFAFPIYVWFLVSMIILTSRHSITVTKLIGSNPIAVLATLLLMSYTKVLKIIIEVYSSVKLNYPENKTMTVWLKDANVPYLQSWHLALTVVTTVVLIFLFLPYTLLLLLGYKFFGLFGKKYSRWLNKLKPLLDSYYAPYRMHSRYWTGFLLLIRCALYLVFSFNSLGDVTKSFLAINIALVVVIACLSFKVYSNYYTNALEVAVYSNLIALSTAGLAGVNSQKVVNSMVGIVFSIMIGIILYHFHILYATKSTTWLKLLAKLTSVVTAKKQKANETTPLLPPTGNGDTPPPQKHVITRSVVSIRNHF